MGSGDGYGYSTTNSNKRSGGGTQGGSFPMRQLKSAGRRKNGSAKPKDQSLYVANRDHGVYIYNIEGPAHAPGIDTAANNGAAGQQKVWNADATSTDSNDSQKMIIRKDITWQIQRDSAGL
ncbi:hypothetical protein LTR08_001966 [Meristemomyces frigidus]|nr:hypothetical protein LTR08_001966 [Meristemomyces frigidus]